MRGQRQEAFRNWKDEEEAEVKLFLSAWTMEDGTWKGIR